MAKEVFGEYAAFVTQGGVRFQKNNKLISENAVPQEVVAYLRNKLNVHQTASEPTKIEPKSDEIVTQRFPMPTEEEKARMREESLRVKPELQLSPEEEAVRALTGVPDNEAPLTPTDFDEEPIPMSELVGAEDLVGEPIKETISEITTHAENSPKFHRGFAEASEAASPQVDPDFLESVSIFTASLEDMVQALYDRFGIYTVYLKKPPQSDEVNPITGEAFTNYHLGIAYQAALAAQSRGILDHDPSQSRRDMDAGRAASANVADSMQPVAYTMGEARRQNNFDYRTSVRGSETVANTEIVHEVDANGQVHAVQRPIQRQQVQEGSGAPSRMPRGDDEDEPILEPPIMGTRPIIRPNW